MDRTPELFALADVFLTATPEVRVTTKSSVLLKPAQSRLPLHQQAGNIDACISDLRSFILENQRVYIGTGVSSTREDKDRIEREVGAVVRTCSNQIDALKASVVAIQDTHRGSGRHVHAIAHFHGVVLILAEKLAAVSRVFDRCRATRYKQMMDEEGWRTAHRRTLGRLPGTGHDPQLPSEAGMEGAGDLQQQQVQEASPQDQALLEHLNRLSGSALGLERVVQDIATLNQMFSTAVLHQAEQIETIYLNALDATQHITLGNKELVKTVAVNRSSRRYLAWFLIAASLCVLFYDWFNS